MLLKVVDPTEGVIRYDGADVASLKGRQLREFARLHDLPYLDLADLIRYRSGSAELVRPAGSARLPTDHGVFEATCFRSVHDGIEHIALTMGDVAAAGESERGVLVRVHSECLTGDLFASRRCDCGTQLRAALAMIAEEGVGGHLERDLVLVDDAPRVLSRGG